jgi:hypothetical protein
MPEVTDIERNRLEFDYLIRKAELEEKREARLSEAAFKERELALEHGRGLKFSTAQATVAAAVLALLSGVIGGLIQSWATRDVEANKSAALIQIERVKADANIALEKQRQDAAERLDREKFETTLILKATEAVSRDDQIRNLKFFLNAGFIRDPDGKIAAMDTQSYPSTPSIEGPHFGTALRAVAELSPSSSVQRYAASVGALQLGGQSNIQAMCTGWLIDDSHIVTASFCIGEAKAEDLTFRMDSAKQKNSYPISRIVQKDDGLKYAVLELSKPVTQGHGSLQGLTRTPVVGEKVIIIEYDSGSIKRVSDDDCVVIKTPGTVNPMTPKDTELAYSCDNAQGSSGAPVIAAKDGAVVGIHLGGTATSSFGVLLASIAKKDPTIAAAFHVNEK